MKLLLCPICKSELTQCGNSLRCEKSHCFDLAREGYVNLLTGSKSGELIGDNADMARCRKNFLDKGYFQPLAERICEIINESNSRTVVDICCGEGYYTEYIKANTGADIYGFDISKQMVRLAAKRRCGANFFVANMADIPLADSAADCAVHLFAPFCENEFARIIKSGGLLISVAPGRHHLHKLKEKLYDTPYENDEAPPELKGFTLIRTENVQAEIHLNSSEDIDALFRMTPYYYHTSQADKEKLTGLDSLDTQTDFFIRIYLKDIPQGLSYETYKTRN
ncbi:MAG: methyltransferase domain-containing protein [Clostridia bacterium]|nr:methyltransferase domain-containing protein [Clostridia bacterium]